MNIISFAAEHPKLMLGITGGLVVVNCAVTGVTVAKTITTTKALNDVNTKLDKLIAAIEEADDDTEEESKDE